MNPEFPDQARAHFYLRIADGLREIAQRKLNQENQRMTKAVKVNIQEALDRLVTCPICGGKLNTYVGAEQERECEHECGVFSMTAVYLDGDVEFSFIMTPLREVKTLAETDENVQLGGPSS